MVASVRHGPYLRNTLQLNVSLHLCPLSLAPSTVIRHVCLCVCWCEIVEQPQSAGKSKQSKKMAEMVKRGLNTRSKPSQQLRAFRSSFIISTHKNDIFTSSKHSSKRDTAFSLVHAHTVSETMRGIFRGIA